MRMHPLTQDEQGSTAAAALPLVFATIGMVLLGAGAILMIPPLAFAGVGVTVIGFASYLIVSSLDRADRRREEARAERSREAKAAYAKERHAASAPRNPLADQAVAALTGEGKGGIYPPLPSKMRSGEIAVPEHGAPAAAANGVWAPGAKTTPPGWDDGADVDVEFEEVPPQMAAQLAGGGTEWANPTPDVARPNRVQPAQADPVERDYRIWPGAQDVASWSTFTGESRPRPERHSEADLKQAMEERRRRIADKLPTVGAILADVKNESETDRLRREATRGKCSKCEAIIWAPKKRPIVLKCPGCGHKAKLY